MSNNINVVLATLTPVGDYEKDKNGKQIIQTVRRPPEKILELNRWIKQFAAERGLVYLDYFTATVDDKGFFKEDLTYDGLHPNAKGYRIMKPLAEAAIDRALKRKDKR